MASPTVLHGDSLSAAKGSRPAALCWHDVACKSMHKLPHLTFDVDPPRAPVDRQNTLHPADVARAAAQPGGKVGMDAEISALFRDEPPAAIPDSQHIDPTAQVPYIASRQSPVDSASSK